MANPEHLEILKQGPKVWNKWRRENPKLVPLLHEVKLNEVELRNSDLSRTCLKKVNLSGADLVRVNLRGADLSQADLSEVDLREADLRDVNLSEVNLRKAMLIGTLFHQANLSGANLSRATLYLANLIETNLNGTDFYRTEFYDTRISNCYTLSKAKNLDKIDHWNNSALDVVTLRACVSELPYVFLQGVGYTNEEIEILKAQYSTPIKYYSCFISYSSKDEESVKDLHSKLRDANITVWFAPEDLKIGDKLRDRINEQIRIYDKLLIVLSENSVKSSWAKYEVETALNREIKENKTILFPIRLDDSIFDINESWAIDIQSRHIGDFRNWKKHDDYKKSLERLIKDLKAVEK